MVEPKTPTQIQKLFDPNLLGAYCQRKRIRLLILFGSHAAQPRAAGSDVDLAVQMDPGAEPDRLELIFDLEGIFSPRPVDLVLLTPLTSPLLLQEIFSKGHALYEGTPGEFQRGRLRAWKLYQDTAPLRRLGKHFLEDVVRSLRHVP